MRGSAIDADGLRAAQLRLDLFMAFQLLTCMRALLFVPEGQTILAQQFIAGKGRAYLMSAVGTAESRCVLSVSSLQPSLRD